MLNKLGRSLPNSLSPISFHIVLASFPTNLLLSKLPQSQTPKKNYLYLSKSALIQPKKKLKIEWSSDETNLALCCFFWTFPQTVGGCSSIFDLPPFLCSPSAWRWNPMWEMDKHKEGFCRKAKTMTRCLRGEVLFTFSLIFFFFFLNKSIYFGCVYLLRKRKYVSQMIL